jgi:hypothetical protein
MYGMGSSQKLNPIHVTYEYEPTVIHNFGVSKEQCRTVIVSLKIKVQNLLQTNETSFDFQIEALQNWSGNYQLGQTGNSNASSKVMKTSDVSDGESFVWVGKTSHWFRNLKANVSVSLLLCSPKVLFVFVRRRARAPL